MAAPFYHVCKNIVSLSAGKDIVVYKDPNGLEEVVRSEGKYPERENFNMMSSMSWLYNNRSKVKASFVME